MTAKLRRRPPQDEHLERRDAFAEVCFDDRWDRMWLFDSLGDGDASDEPLEALSTA